MQDRAGNRFKPPTKRPAPMYSRSFLVRGLIMMVGIGVGMIILSSSAGAGRQAILRRLNEENSTHPSSRHAFTENIRTVRTRQICPEIPGNLGKASM